MALRTGPALRRTAAAVLLEFIARMPDHELWMAFFDDSEGNMLAIMSEIR